MIDRLLEWVMSVLDDLLPFAIIPYYDKGVRLRLGLPTGGPLEPGFHWKIPFFDVILTQMVKTKTINLVEQRVTTKDGICLMVKGVIKYEVEDVETLLLEVNDPIDACADMVQGIIRDKIIGLNWSDCNTDSLTGMVNRAAKAEAKKWGVKIDKVTLTDLGILQTITFNAGRADLTAKIDELLK